MRSRLASAALLAAVFTAPLLLAGCGGSSGSTDPSPATCTPVAESCNGLDDDCDGQVDQGIAGCCTPAAQQPCGVAQGACVIGTATCGADRAWGACLDGGGAPVVLPATVTESCNGLDDDCDGETDEGFTALGTDCTVGVGACEAAGLWVCDGAGTGVECSASPGAPSTEYCDGVDNDCDAGTPDGAADPLNAAACDGPDADLCNEGSYACVGGQLACSDSSGDAVELCNGADDDCNPATADGSSEATLGTTCDGPDADLCKEGTWSCALASMVCSDATGTVVDVCNGLDDDCDSATLDGSGEATYGAACDGPDADLCAEGTWSCASASMACTDVSGNAIDLCNGADDDCNPATPDGSGEPTLGTACDGTDGDLCKEGTWSCAGGALSCSDATGTVVDVCNGLDDDCDSVADQDFKAGGSVSINDYDGSTGLHLGDACGRGRCAGGLVTCDANDLAGLTLTCDTWVQMRPEYCDGIDDDCDGQVDDTPRLTNCELQMGVCAGKKHSVCAGTSGWLPCTATDYGASYQATESLCDGKDNDCDGATDEVLTGPACENQLGVCAGATKACGGAGGWLACTNATYEAYNPTFDAAIELSCADGLDNDCDGMTDFADLDCPYARTINVASNANDFTADEQFPTTSGGYQSWITWDAGCIYVGYAGPAVAMGDGAKRLLVHLRGVGPGTATGMTFGTQSPLLPFEATHVAMLHMGYTYRLFAFDGAAWNVHPDFFDWSLSSNLAKMCIHRSSLGNPSAVAVHVSMIDSTAAAEWTWGGVPSTSFTDGFDPDFAHYYLFDLTARAAPGTYTPQ